MAEEENINSKAKLLASDKRGLVEFPFIFLKFILFKWIYFLTFSLKVFQ